jgi:RsiW-degrading membrane proteinase PrsW (M82 family)
MRPIHDHETQTGHVISQSRPWETPMRASEILELLTIPLLFAALFRVWPLLVGGPAPWWVVAGLLFYGGLAAAALAYSIKACADGGRR